MPDLLELANDVTFGTVELTVDTAAVLPKGVIAKVNFDPLMWLDAPTPDGRYFYGNGFKTVELPAFLQYKDQTTVEGGHHGARICGSLRGVDVEQATGKVSGWGYLIDNQAGRDCLLALDTKSIKGVSADLRGCALDTDGTTALGVRGAYATSLLAGATICPMPAFPDTMVTVEPVGAIVASGTLVRDLKPPRDAFSDPKFNRPTGIRVVPLTSEFDQVFGHLALWNVPHTSIQGRKVYPPRDDDLSKFYTGGSVLCADGAFVKVGRLFLGDGHPDTKMPAQQALDTYARTCDAWADVRVGKDKFGIWVAGVTRPGISEELVYAGRASPLSGDWRPIDGRKRLVAALSCNFPGFPVYEDDDDGALIASGPPPELDDADVLDQLHDAAVEGDAAAAAAFLENADQPPVAARRRPVIVRGDILSPTRIYGGQELAPDVQVRSYIRNGRVVRASRRRGRARKPTVQTREQPKSQDSIIEKIIDYGLGPADKPTGRPKIAPSGSNKITTKRQTTTYGTVEVNGDHPTVEVVGDPTRPVNHDQGAKGFEVKVNVTGALGKLPKGKRDDLQRRINKAIKKWIDSWPDELNEDFVDVDPPHHHMMTIDPSKMLQDKVFKKHVQPLIDKVVDEWAVANGGDLTGRLPPKVIPSKKAK